MKVVVLCGGKGTRLGLTDRPKPMVDLMGKPVLEHLVELARRHGFEEFVFLNGHLAEVIEAHFGDGSTFGVRITHVREETPLGTAGAVRAARSLLTEPFLVLYGDIYSDIDLADFAAFARTRGGAGAVFVHPNDHPFDSDLVETEDGDRIRRFLPKPHAEGAVLPNLVSGAIYVLTPQAIDHIPAEGASDFGREVLPAMVEAGADLYAYLSLEYSKDIGTPERLKKVAGDIQSGRVERMSRRTQKPAIFLDRDGVLNFDEAGGVHRPEEMHLMPDAGEAVRAINKAGLPAICITNQPDIAKGLFTPEDLRQVFAALDTRLSEHGAYLDDAFYCPHHPDKGFAGEIAELKVRCDCRKPAPGLILQAAARHNLDLSRSWMIGDRYCDVAAAQAAGARGAMVLTGEAGSDRAKFPNITPDLIAPTLGEAVARILEQMA
jgi:histidinol-phosphate phosphatase family protein